MAIQFHQGVPVRTLIIQIFLVLGTVYYHTVSQVKEISDYGYRLEVNQFILYKKDLANKSLYFGKHIFKETI